MGLLATIGVILLISTIGGIIGAGLEILIVGLN